MWVLCVSSCDTVTCPFCDHCAVVMSVRVPEAPTHGPGVWKPRSDGLPMEFYVKLWPLLGVDIVNVLDSCCLSGAMSLT